MLFRREYSSPSLNLVVVACCNKDFTIRQRGSCKIPPLRKRSNTLREITGEGGKVSNPGQSYRENYRSCEFLVSYNTESACLSRCVALKSPHYIMAISAEQMSEFNWFISNSGVFILFSRVTFQNNKFHFRDHYHSLEFKSRIYIAPLPDWYICI